MPQKSSVRTSWITAGLCIYAAASLFSMAAMSIGTGVLILCLLIGLGPRGFLSSVRNELRHRPARVLFVFSALLALACVASLVYAKWNPVSFGSYQVDVNSLFEFGKLWYLFWPFLLAAGLRAVSEEQRGRVAAAWLVAFGILSAVGIYQYYTGWPRPQVIPGTPRYHAILFLGHHLSVASILIFPFFAALDLLKKRAGPRWVGLPRVLLFLFVVLGAVTLFLTYSRMLWAALPVGLLIWALLALPKRWAAAAVLALVIGGVAAYQVPQIQKRVRDSMGVGTRQLLWKANLAFFEERPVFGVGFRENHELSRHYFVANFPRGDRFFTGHAHNNALDMLGGTGFFGFSAWLLWSLSIFVLLWPLLRNRPEAFFVTGLFAAWIVFHLNGLTQLNFWEGKVQHQMMWSVGWILLWRGKREDRR